MRNLMVAKPVRRLIFTVRLLVILLLLNELWFNPLSPRHVMELYAAAHRLCEIVRERGVWDISYIDEEHLRPHDWYSGHSEMLLFGSRTVDLAKKEKARRYSSDYPYESDGYKESPINEVWAQECLKEINIAPSTQYLFTLKDNVYWNQVLELIFYTSQSKKEYIVTYYYLDGEFLWRRADIFSY